MARAMASESFQVADIVKLKSGGPPMTIESVNGADGKVYCVWFVEGEIQAALFTPETLIRASAE